MEWLIGFVALSLVAGWLLTRLGGSGADTDKKREPRLPDADFETASPETAHKEKILADGLNIRVSLRYLDINKTNTNRIVVFKQALGDPKRPQSGDVVKLRGYCAIRQGIRTFVVSRISSIADPETGEIIDMSQKISEQINRRMGKI